MPILMLLVLTAPRPYVCTLDGAELKVVADSAEVVTDKLLGRRLGFSLAGDAPGGFPRIDVTAAWAKIEGKKEVSLAVENPRLGGDVQAFFRAGTAEKQLTTEKATLKLSFAEQVVSATFDVTFRAKDPALARRKLTCTLEKLPLVVQP